MQSKNNIKIPILFPVACHTDNIGKGGIFVAIKGMSADGVAFIPLAIKKGSTTIVVDQMVSLPAKTQKIVSEKNIKIIRVKNTRKALATLSAQAAGFPARTLKIIGVTGTKGKTTTAYLLYHILKTAGYSTALLSTVKNSINDCDFISSLTTAHPDYLHQFLKTALEHGVTHVVMEVAAQATTLHRVEGLLFDAVIFTNFSLEHSEFYDSMESYFAAKCALLQQRKKDAPLFINGDDTWCSTLIKKYENIVTFGNQDKNNVRISFDTIEPSITGTIFYIKPLLISCPSLMGTFNGYNILAACVAALHFSVSFKICQQALQTFTGVPGRLERYHLPNGALCYIDYAHNPSSYELVLGLLRKQSKQLIVVFGCGGGRDKNKRPIMGKIASELADKVILTSDNPRYEDLQKIINHITSGISKKNKHKMIAILDRAKAIKKAFELSDTKTTIAVLGKGPDGYELIGDKKIPYLDAEVIQRLR